MSYIGNLPTNVAFVTDNFSGDGSTVAFTMSVAPASTSSILVAITGVLQDPNTYSVYGTTLTFSAAPPSGTGNVSVRYLGVPASGVTTTAYRTVTEFTTTAGQTTFSVPSYTVGYIDVYRNGSRLGTADYTATNGTTVVLAAACNAGDLVVTESFYVSSVLNAIPATAGAVNDSYISAVSASKLTGSRTLPSGTLPAGTVLQVQSTAKTDTFSTTSPSLTDITGLSVSITPTSSTSKVFVSVTLYVSCDTQTANSFFMMIRDSTYIDRGTTGTGYSAGIRYYADAQMQYSVTPITMTYLDSPATTSATTYKVQTNTNAGTVVVGGPYNTGGFGSVSFPSVITVMEVAV